MITDDLEQAANPLQTSNRDSAESVNTGSSLTKKKINSPNRITSVSATDSGLIESPHKDFPASELQGSNSPSKPNLIDIAQRCQEMKAWEGDYSYHPTNHNSQVEVEGSLASLPLSDMHGSPHILNASNTDAKVPPTVSSLLKFESQSYTKTNDLGPCPSPMNISENNKPKYYFGEGHPNMVFSGDSGNSLALSSTWSMASSNDLCTSSSAYPPTPQSEMSRDKTVLHQTESHASPTKKLVWDQGMLNSLVSA